MFVEETVAAPAPRQVARDVRSLTEGEFDAFYKRNARPLMGYIQRMCGDATLAEDLFQKSFYLFVRTPLPVNDEEQMRPYLYRIATNVVRDHWRARARHGSESVLEEVADQARPVKSFELRHDFQKTFQKLTPNERALLWFAHVEGLDHREVAQRVGVKEKSVRVLLHRARRRLEQLLGQLGLQREPRT